MNEKEGISTDPIHTKKVIKGYYRFTNTFGNLDKMEKFLKNTVCPSDRRNGYPK